MSLFHKLRWHGWRLRRDDAHDSRTTDAAMRHCHFERLEDRRVLSAVPSPILVGGVYFEDAGDADEGGDRFVVTFSGGAAGTHLTQLVIELDKNSNGQRDPAECLFDTTSASPGDFGWAPYVTVSLVGIDSVSASVVDGGDKLVLTFVGFEAGDRIIFSIDVDEQGSSHPNAVAEGDEFEDSRLRAFFEADHYYAAEGVDDFKDEYDAKLNASGLTLPPDRYDTSSEEGRPALTAGAVYSIQQEELPVSISGTVFEDPNLTNTQQTGEPGLAGVSLSLLEFNGTDYVATGKTTVTDSLGNYSFTNLDAGKYRVVETQPTGYLSVGAAAGTVGGATRGSAYSADIITDVELVGGESSVDNDFAEVRPARLSGHVYHDADNDGVFDATEQGIGGAKVYITRVFDDGFPNDDEFPDDDLVTWDTSIGAPILVTTAADGSWASGDLMPGEYIVTEVTPDGYLDGLDAAGTAGGTAHNPGDSIDGIILVAAQSGLNYDFGELLPGKLCGFVYVDANDNHLRDAGEEGIPGVQLTLLDENGVPTGLTAWTDEFGHYCFEDLAPGQYGISEAQPTGYFDSADQAGTLGGTAHNPGDLIDVIPLGSEQHGQEYNFGERELVSISGYVYVDADNDGVRDSGEIGIAGVTVALLDASDNPTGQTTTTDAAGYYEFAQLAPGVYGVAETQPAGYKDGLDSAGSAGGVPHNPGDSITDAALVGGVAGVEYNFGEILPARIAGSVFVDVDGDCKFDSGEEPIPGVTIQLLDADGNQIGVTTTDTLGNYAFENLDPGTYGLREIQPTAFLDGAEKAGSLGGALIGNDLMGKIDVEPGDNGIEYNFCEIRPATISGYVFQDGPAVQLQWNEDMPDVADIRDGQKTSDDTPLVGVRLQLGDGSGAPILDKNGDPITTVTDKNGYYEFTGLTPDVYTILELHPTGYIDSIDTAGSVGGLAINPKDNIAPATLALLSVDPKDDAIIEIVVTAGTNGVSYNFSEVKLERLTPPGPPPMPEPDPVVIPDPQAPFGEPVIHTLPHPFMAAPEWGTISGGGGLPMGWAWHLSVINAGDPRRHRQDADTVDAATVSMFNPISWSGGDMSRGRWTLADAQGRAVRDLAFGMDGAIPVTGDFNGDGNDEIGVFLDGEWLLDLNGNGVWDNGDLWARLGDPGDLPVTGDWDGDGKTDIGIFGRAWQGDAKASAVEAGLPDSLNLPTSGRYKNIPPDAHDAPERKRFMKRSADGTIRADVIDHVFLYGVEGDHPFAGDFNGDGVSTVGVFRNGNWFIDNDGNGRWSKGDEYFELGEKGDLPVVGDFNQDGIDEAGVYREGKWLLDTNNDHILDARDQVFELGGPGDVPVTGDFDGDGRDEIGVHHTGPTADQQASR